MPSVAGFSSFSITQYVLLENRNVKESVALCMISSFFGLIVKFVD
jgi:fluoride ion exporter CrcB/FEX